MKSKVIYVDFSKKHKTTFIMFVFHRFLNILTQKFKSHPSQNAAIKNIPDNVKQLFY